MPFPPPPSLADIYIERDERGIYIYCARFENRLLYVVGRIHFFFLPRQPLQSKGMDGWNLPMLTTSISTSYANPNMKDVLSTRKSPIFVLVNLREGGGEKSEWFDL